MLKKQTAKEDIKWHDSFNPSRNVFDVPKRLKHGMEMPLQRLAFEKCQGKGVGSYHEDVV